MDAAAEADALMEGLLYLYMVGIIVAWLFGVGVGICCISIMVKDRVFDGQTLIDCVLLFGLFGLIWPAMFTPLFPYGPYRK